MATSRLCSIPNCGKPRYSMAGYCSTHQYRFKNYGSPFGKHPANRAHHEEHVAFLHSLFDAAETAECVIWPFGRNTYGYGQTTHEGRKWLVHTLVCFKSKGPRPSSRHQAAHSCGNGHLGCINPVHLSWKTPKENQGDRRAHGTNLPGEKSPLAKVTSSDVRHIRSMIGLCTQRKLAEKFGLTQSAISLIQSGKLWRDTA